MSRLSPLVLRCLFFPICSVVLLFATSCTSRLSVVDVPAPAMQAQDVLAQALPGPTATTLPPVPSATFTAMPTFTPQPTATSTSLPATPTPLPTQVPTQIPATVPTLIPTHIPTTAPTLVPVASEPGVPTRLVIPAINLDAPVIEMGWSLVERNGQQVSEWDVPDWRAVGWLKTSARLGVVGNSVLEGHQNVYGRVFEYLDLLKEGDTLQVYAGSVVRNYVITSRVIVAEKDQPMDVRLQNAQWIAPKDDERLTLITCYPRNANTHRLILVAYPQP